MNGESVEVSKEINGESVEVSKEINGESVEVSKEMNGESVDVLKENFRDAGSAQTLPQEKTTFDDLQSFEHSWVSICCVDDQDGGTRLLLRRDSGEKICKFRDEVEKRKIYRWKVVDDEHSRREILLGGEHLKIEVKEASEKEFGEVVQTLGENAGKAADDGMDELYDFSMEKINLKMDPELNNRCGFANVRD